MIVPLAWACGCRPAPPPEEITYHYNVIPVDRGHPMLAAGDTMSFQVDSSECHGDVCLSGTLPQSEFRWSVSAPGVATVDPERGLVRALEAGVLVLSAKSTGAREAQDTIRVYPPVTRLDWVPQPTSAVAGDTLRVAVVARDKSGGEVARLPAHSILGGTGGSGELLDWGGATPTTVWLNGPGILTLVARLANRWDTLRITVDSLVTPPIDTVPNLGSVVRVQGPSLGDGWHVALFNMLRLPARCYRAVIFGRSLAVVHMLPMKDLSRMQVAERVSPRKANALPMEDGPHAEFHAPAWREVSLPPLIREPERCDQPPKSPRH